MCSSIYGGWIFMRFLHLVHMGNKFIIDSWELESRQTSMSGKNCKVL